MPPLTKTCPKMVLSHKGGSLCVKDALAKKFFGVGRDSAGGALASVLRKHSSEGRTPDADERCIRHCAGSGRQGDRIGVGLAAIVHSRLWHEPAVLCVPANVCSWGKSGCAADITAMTDFEPKAVIGRTENPQHSSLLRC